MYSCTLYGYPAVVGPVLVCLCHNCSRECHVQEACHFLYSRLQLQYG